MAGPVAAMLSSIYGWILNGSFMIKDRSGERLLGACRQSVPPSIHSFFFLSFFLRKPCYAFKDDAECKP